MKILITSVEKLPVQSPTTLDKTNMQNQSRSNLSLANFQKKSTNLDGTELLKALVAMNQLQQKMAKNMNKFKSIQNEEGCLEQNSSMRDYLNEVFDKFLSKDVFNKNVMLNTSKIEERICDCNRIVNQQPLSLIIISNEINNKKFGTKSCLQVEQNIMLTSASHKDHTINGNKKVGQLKNKLKKQKQEECSHLGVFFHNATGKALQIPSLSTIENINKNNTIKKSHIASSTTNVQNILTNFDNNNLMLNDYHCRIHNTLETNLEPMSSNFDFSHTKKVIKESTIQSKLEPHMMNSNIALTKPITSCHYTPLIQNGMTIKVQEQSSKIQRKKYKGVEPLCIPTNKPCFSKMIFPLNTPINMAQIKDYELHNMVDDPILGP